MDRHRAQGRHSSTSSDTIGRFVPMECGYVLWPHGTRACFRHAICQDCRERFNSPTCRWTNTQAGKIVSKSIGWCDYTIMALVLFFRSRTSCVLFSSSQMTTGLLCSGCGTPLQNAHDQGTTRRKSFAGGAWMLILNASVIMHTSADSVR
jgi:hypothetical protein